MAEPDSILICALWPGRSGLCENARTLCAECGIDLAIDKKNVSLGLKTVCIHCALSLIKDEPESDFGGFMVGGKMYATPLEAWEAILLSWSRN